MVACFTGHRPNKLGGYKAEDNKELLWRLHKVIVDHIENKNVDTFINGLALGIDLWAAKIVIKLKEKYPHIKLISAIPCRNHPSKWNEESKLLWQEVCDKSDEVVLVTDEDYKPYLMQVRNVWMVDKSNFVIGVHDGTEGGTNNCLKYAEKIKKQITIIKP
jgi:uncharacterized phage-like protein YoqJ